MTKTTIENYQERAGRTMASLGTLAADGMHMAAGFTTEIGEMKEGIANNDLVNVLEEIGDVWWYCANECTLYGFDLQHIVSLATVSEEVPFFLHNIVDLHKREFAYGKEMDIVKLKVELLSLAQYLLKIGKTHYFSLGKILDKNINKLYKRYPEKFTEDKALNRDLEAEYKTLK